MAEALARAAYSLLLTLLAPVYVLRLWLRGRAEPPYRDAIAERFGIYRQAVSGSGSRSRLASESGAEAGLDSGANDRNRWVWVHAVSLGETRAAGALIEALRTERPGIRLLLTHGTATGRDAGRCLLREGDEQVWLPYDTMGATRRFIARFRPAVGVLMETEVWPNLLHAARRAGVPMVLANARLSERSLARGRRVALLLRPAIRSFARVLAQTDADAQRLRSAGSPEVEVAGNLKYDLTPDAALLAQGRAWRLALARPVVLAAVTREGEEALLLAAWRRHRPEGALLVIVPRHPQRFDEVAALVGAAGLTLARRSRWAGMPPPEALGADAWLGDSMGEMALYYASADLALLGGSFAPFGGQNLIEAAACACPLLIGPSTFNFAEAAGLSLGAGASLRVADLGDGLEEVQRLLRAPDALVSMRRAALAFAAEHRGAAARMARRILPVMDRG